MFYSSDGIRTVMPSYQGAAWMMDGDIFTPTMTPPDRKHPAVLFTVLGRSTR